MRPDIRFLKAMKFILIVTPDKPKASDTAYQRYRKCRKCRARAGIEPIIGHPAKDFRMEQNYLMCEKDMQINALLIASAWNLKKMTEKPKEDFLVSFFDYSFIKTFMHCPIKNRLFKD